MMNKNILQIITYYVDYGGEVAVANYDKKILEKAGYTVDQFILDNQYLKKNIFYTLYILLNLNRNLFTKLKLRKYLKKNDTAIIHIHSYFPQFPLSLLCYLKKFNVKIILSIHNYRLICSNGFFFKNNAICFDCLNKKFWSAVKKKCYKNSKILSFLAVKQINKLWQHKTLNQNVDIFLCNHDFIKKIHIQYGINEERIVIRNNPISELFTNFDKKIIINKKKFALFVGRDSEEKGLSDLIDAWSNIDYKLILIGNFKTQKKLSIYDQFEFPGFCNDIQKKSYFQDAQFLVFTSKWHEAGIPLVILESLACGTPVICANIEPMDKIIINGFNGLLYKKNDINDLRDKINLLIYNPLLAKKLSINAKTSFNKNYSLDLSTSKLLEVYDNLIN